MRYLTHYKEYPIYEPAEGGYYYVGNEKTDYWKLSKRSARKMIKEIYEELINENVSNRFEFPKIFMSNDGNRIYKVNSQYIGDAETWVIERKLGKETRGWRPYC